MSRFNRDWKAIYFPRDDIWDVDASEKPTPSDDPSERFSVLESLSGDDACLIAASPALAEACEAYIEGDARADYLIKQAFAKAAGKSTPKTY